MSLGTSPSLLLADFATAFAFSGAPLGFITTRRALRVPSAPPRAGAAEQAQPRSRAASRGLQRAPPPPRAPGDLRTAAPPSAPCDAAGASLTAAGAGRARPTRGRCGPVPAPPGGRGGRMRGGGERLRALARRGGRGAR